jgi:hypothetical protein
MNKAMGTIEIDKLLEVAIGEKFPRSKRMAAAPHPAGAEHEADNLDTLFRRMTKLSMSEVESLIDQLQGLRKKLENDGDLIERAIVRHSEHSQGVMQLTTIIADNVKKLPPGAPDTRQ